LALPIQLDEVAPAWRKLHASLRRTVGDSAYDIWLSRLELKAWDGAVLLLQAPSDTEAWVAKRFGRILEDCARHVFGDPVSVAFTGARPGTARGAPRGRHGSTRADADARWGAPSPERGSRLNPRFSFDQFVIGDGNRLAHAAALAVAENPGQTWNPLFLHAPPGLGKTHLLHAIGNYIVAFGSGATVRYTTVEAFTNHFIGSLSTHSVDRFKTSYRDADVLLIDDVQFLGSKAKTGEEFFHTFNSLHQAGRQLVLTCDRLPRQLVEVEARLRERFESGLVADIDPPDFATRLTILRKRAALDDIMIPDNAVFELIAARITDNVRALEGALIRIVAHHSLTGRPIDAVLARHVLDGIAPVRSRPDLSIQAIQSAASSYFGVDAGALCSASRTAPVAWARQVAIHLARELADHSLADIGTAFGGRNHATVLHACKRVSERLVKDLNARADVDKLASMLRSEQRDRTC